MAKRWYVVHVYSGFEKKIAQQVKEDAAQAKGLAELIDDVLVPAEDVTEVRRGQKVNVRAQVLPGLHPGEDGADGRILAPGQGHAQGDRLPRLQDQADADLERPRPSAS